MHTLSCLRIIILVSPVFPDIHTDMDANNLFLYDFSGSFKTGIIKNFLWSRQIDNRLRQFLLFATMPFMPRLSARLATSLFAVVGDLFVIY